MLKRIHHLGIIVDDLENKMKRFERFGLRCSQVVENKEGGYKIAFFPIGEVLIELISYSPDKEPDHTSKIVRAHKDVINHICLEVEDITAEIERLKKHGFLFVNETPSEGGDGYLVVFLHPKSTNGVLIELAEKV